MIDCLDLFIVNISSRDVASESRPLFLEASEVVISFKVVESFRNVGLIPP